MTQEEIDTEIGARVHSAMWRAKVSQKSLSEALGFDQAALSRRLRGRTQWKVAEVFLAARMLGVSPLDLMPMDAATGKEALTSDNAVSSFTCSPTAADPTRRRRRRRGMTLERGSHLRSVG